MSRSDFARFLRLIEDSRALALSCETEPMSRKAAAGDFASKNDAENITIDDAWRLRNSLPNIGLQFGTMFLRRQDGTTISEAEMRNNDEQRPNKLNYWVEISSPFQNHPPQNLATLAARIKSIQAIQDTDEAFPEFLRLIEDSTGGDGLYAQNKILESGVVRQAVVNHLRSVVI